MQIFTLHKTCSRALLALQAAVEEGIVAGGGSTLLKLAQKVDAISATLDNDEQKVGAEIVRRALSYPLRLIANNAGVNGSVVVQKVCPLQDKFASSPFRKALYLDMLPKLHNCVVSVMARKILSC